jgi:hypothetical protein
MSFILPREMLIFGGQWEPDFDDRLNFKAKLSLVEFEITYVSGKMEN